MLEANIVGYGNTLSYSDDHEVRKIIDKSTTVDLSVTSGAILTFGTTGVASWVCDCQIDNHKFKFRDPNNNVIGTLDFSKEPITFEGNFHESAKIFAKYVSRIIHHTV